MQATPTVDEEPKTGITARRDVATELSARRTGLSFQRTRMSADRTLMSIIRTSLSLISFGFTIFQLFQKLHEARVIRPASARHFGTALLALGGLMLVGGIAYHVAFMVELRKERAQMKTEGLIHADSTYPVSLTLVTAVALLVIAVLALFSIVTKSGPFE